MPYDLSDMEKMEQFYRRCKPWNTPLGKALANSKSPNDTANFVQQAGAEVYPNFCTSMITIFGQDIKLSCKTNVTRIA